MGSGSDTSVDNSNASGASDKTGTESDNVVMVGGSFEKDGLKGTVNDADTDFTDYDDPYGFYKPGDGKKYVKADFSFENNGKSDAYVSSADFSCYADNESCDQSFIASVNEFSGDTLSTGRKISFSVVFEVPVDAESIELEYTANIWSSEKSNNKASVGGVEDESLETGIRNIINYIICSSYVSVMRRRSS